MTTRKSTTLPALKMRRGKAVSGISSTKRVYDRVLARGKNPLHELRRRMK